MSMYSPPFDTHSFLVIAMGKHTMCAAAAFLVVVFFSLFILIPFGTPFLLLLLPRLHHPPSAVCKEGRRGAATTLKKEKKWSVFCFFRVKKESFSTDFNFCLRLLFLNLSSKIKEVFKKITYLDWVLIQRTKWWSFDPSDSKTKQPRLQLRRPPLQRDAGLRLPRRHVERIRAVAEDQSQQQGRAEHSKAKRGHFHLLKNVSV